MLYLAVFVATVIGFPSLFLLLEWAGDWLL